MIPGHDTSFFGIHSSWLHGTRRDEHDIGPLPLFISRHLAEHLLQASQIQARQLDLREREAQSKRLSCSFRVRRSTAFETKTNHPCPRGSARLCSVHLGQVAGVLFLKSKRGVQFLLRCLPDASIRPGIQQLMWRAKGVMCGGVLAHTMPTIASTTAVCLSRTRDQ